MQTFLGAIFCAVMLAVILILRVWRKKSVAKIYDDMKEKENSYTLIVGSYDWGPAVDKIILNPKLQTFETDSAKSDFTEDDFAPKNFTVKIRTEIFDYASGKIREIEGNAKVKSAWASDIDGNPDSDSEAKHDPTHDDQPVGMPETPHITLALEVHPENQLLSPFIYDSESGHNVWKKKFIFEISHPKFEGTITECNDWYSPDADLFTDMKSTGELKAASFSPEIKDGKKRPLIVWLNGAWEGGRDVNIALLGNKVTALAKNPIQSYFDGAFVLCIQTPTFWMQHGDVPYDILKEDCTDKSSRYTKSCKHVIDKFLHDTPMADKKRIYIGGCSNGGYMTVNMILSYPDFFAAAFPVCEAYNDGWLSDSDIRTLDKVPTWFVHAKNDATVPPEKHVIPTTQRLLSARTGYILHWSFFPDVRDTSGKFTDDKGAAYEYNGHMVWVYLFNDQCSSESGENLWAWISRQSRICEDSGEDL